MEYEIRPLTAGLVNDYVAFFDTEKHSDNKDEHKCYCVCWCSDDHRLGLERMVDAGKRRALAIEYVKTGLIRGYLAYMDNRVVGWCNANDKNKCQHCISWLRFLNDVKIQESGKPKTKAVFCFAIASEYRKKGIATGLLKKVCEDAIKEGYDIVEAYPKKEMKNLDNFEGPLSMYLKQGFSITEDHGEYYTVKKDL
ncbi:MAG TPA: GNAT family N-acetyltransferase [Bacillota bacterium]|nr:GNAT family N-acetyltransferase [Bacillota bacterium]HPQ62182.1 GNAT family N-acetyltransferase [Bacillota bacterium]